jgi:hypothetical protein
VQAIDSDPHRDPVRLHRMLHAAGVRTLMVREREAHAFKLSFVFNVLHRIGDVEQAGDILEAAVGRRLSRHRRRRGAHDGARSQKGFPTALVQTAGSGPL